MLSRAKMAVKYPKQLNIRNWNIIGGFRFILANHTIRSADPENPILEPNIISILYTTRVMLVKDLEKWRLSSISAQLKR